MLASRFTSVTQGSLKHVSVSFLTFFRFELACKFNRPSDAMRQLPQRLRLQDKKAAT
jgi:hypothetical protein